MKNTNQILKFYFLSVKICYLIGVTVALSFFSEGFHWMLVGMVSSAIAFAGLQFFILTKGEKWMSEKNYLGWLVTFCLNTLLLPSFYFPVGLAGVYILLHPKTRENFPAERNPDWMNQFFQWIDGLLKNSVET